MFEKIYALEIFKWIEQDVVQNIINNCKTRKIPASEKIIREGDESNGEWYILKEWNVAISIWWQKVAELSSWDIFWEIALLNEEKRTATVTAITDIEVIVLNLDNLIEMINSDDNTINKTIMSRIEENLERGQD